MNTIAKKTLSLVFAGTMALTSLTVGSVSALAAGASDYKAVTEGVTQLTAQKLLSPLQQLLTITFLSLRVLIINQLHQTMILLIILTLDITKIISAVMHLRQDFLLNQLIQHLIQKV